jgi:hypothetical protein
MSVSQFRTEKMTVNDTTAMDVIVSMLLDWFGFCSLSDLVYLLDMAPPLSCPMISLLFNGVESSGALCLYRWMNVLR